MIVNSIVRMQIGLCLVLLLAVYGCGGGKANMQLSLEEVAQLKHAPHVYIVDYPSPEFTWTIMNSPFNRFPLIVPNAVVSLNLEEVEKWLELPAPLELRDPTHSLRDLIMATLEKKYLFTNLVLPEGVWVDDDLRDLKETLTEGKVIDVKTEFWQIVPGGSESSTDAFLPPKKELYQFQYLAIIRVIDLDGPDVIQQRSCHYPPEMTNMGGWLRPKELGTFSMKRPIWVHSMSVPELIENRGEKIQTQIHQAVRHCLEEFQTLFP